MSWRAACIALRLAEARSGVRDMLRAEGIEERVGYFGRRVSVDDVLESFFAPRRMVANRRRVPSSSRSWELSRSSPTVDVLRTP